MVLECYMSSHRLKTETSVDPSVKQNVLTDHQRAVAVNNTELINSHNKDKTEFNINEINKINTVRVNSS